MIRFLAHTAADLFGAAVALLLAGTMIEGVSLNAGGFLVAVVVLTVAQAVLAPFVFNVARQYASAILGGIGIVSTLLALLIATLMPGGLQITGFSAWLVTSLLVWLVTALGGWLLVTYVVDRWLDRRKAAKAHPSA